MKRIVGESWGKDSLALLLILIEKNYPLDEVIFYNTGMEFKAIYDIRDKVVPVLERRGIKYTELKPEYDFRYKMFEKPVTERGGGTHNGYSWCGGACRWGTTDKNTAISKYLKLNYGEYGRDYIEYVGIAYDERHRAKEKEYPLISWQMTEADCLQYCYSKGFYWEENGVRLYDILDRVSCWCCANKNRKELKNIYQYMPEYWERLKELQSKTDRPMKRFCNKKYGKYGNVFDMERVFKEEVNK
jgi:3'-phosphoadenosine 5'-phosphosulfate sulfotransferase (PAPS reductase)/FAD synthetase